MVDNRYGLHELADILLIVFRVHPPLSLGFEVEDGSCKVSLFSRLAQGAFCQIEFALSTIPCSTSVNLSLASATWQFTNLDNILILEVPKQHDSQDKTIEQNIDERIYGYPPISDQGSGKVLRSE
jgi:hypothetical protein